MFPDTRAGIIEPNEDVLMSTSMLQRKEFAASAFDALSSNICVVNRKGVIMAVNRSWRSFALDNSPVSARTGVGLNYLDVCENASAPDSDEAKTFASGLLSVIKGTNELFQMEYRCNSPTENRWFTGRITPLKMALGGAVISHMNITNRKSLELELAKLAATDTLTGLPNRRYFRDVAANELGRVRRFGNPTSFAMMDLDGFKAVNDTFGHAAGDEALRRVSPRCAASVRQADLLARLGGDEFIFVLPGTNEVGAMRIGEKLIKEIRETLIDGFGGSFNVTASFGVTEILRSDRTIDEGVSRADSALYLAKEAGRNCVKMFSQVSNEV